MVTPVNPEVFARVMREHWETNCNNVTSHAFLDLWSVMARAFNEAIESHGTPSENLWRVLQPSTGTGKTQGARIYSALTIINNMAVRSNDKVGILIVTREIAEAEKLADEINESVRWLVSRGKLGGETSSSVLEVRHPISPASLGQTPGVALAKHSQSPKSMTGNVMAEADVLIITHAAYVKALDNLKHDDDERWSSFIEWQNGTRRLTIVDETISNLVEMYGIDVENLKRTIAHIPDDIQSEFPIQMKYLTEMVAVLRKLREKVTGSVDQVDDGDNISRLVWDSEAKESARHARINATGYDMRLLRARLARHRYDTAVTGGVEDQVVGMVIADRVDRALRDVEAIYSRWAWYAKRGDYDTLNSSRLLLPDTFPAPVVLDATASTQVLWDLLGDKVVRPVVPPHVRSYRNVTLHVAWSTAGTGKTAMVKHGKKRMARLMVDLNSRFAGQDRNVLLVTNKAVEHLAMDHEVTFGSLSVAHWGRIDGRNDWRDCDTVVIAGLQFKGSVWASNLYMSVKGPKGAECLQKGNQLAQQMETKEVIVSVVQALNRVRCRKVIDMEGNCPKTDAFIVLPTGDRGRAILDGIMQEMPEIVVDPSWSFTFEGSRVEIRRGSSHDGIIRLMDNRGPGEVSMGSIQKEFCLSNDAMKDLRKALRNAEHPLSKALAELGVAYVVTGAGRGARSYLVKHAS